MPLWYLSDWHTYYMWRNVTEEPLSHMRARKVQIGWRIRTHWSGPTSSRYRIIGYLGKYRGTNKILIITDHTSRADLGHRYSHCIRVFSRTLDIICKFILYNKGVGDLLMSLELHKCQCFYLALNVQQGYQTDQLTWLVQIVFIDAIL